MELYTVRDEGAQFFLNPFVAENDAIAKRLFIGSLGDTFPFRKDFTLYQVGKFDEANGLLTANDPRLVLAGYNIAESLDPRPRPIHTTADQLAAASEYEL